MYIKQCCVLLSTLHKGFGYGWDARTYNRFLTHVSRLFIINVNDDIAEKYKWFEEYEKVKQERSVNG